MSDEIGRVVRTGIYPDFSNDQQRNIRINRRAETIVLGVFDDMVADGNVFSVNIGVASTQIDFAETAYDEDQPQFGLDVPSGTTCMPLAIQIYLEDGAGTNTEGFFRMDDGLLGAGSSTAATEVSLLQQTSDSQRAARCTARSLYTGNAAAITKGPEFARWGTPFADATTSPDLIWKWSRLEAGFGPVLEGEASISGYILATGTAPQGFLTFTWAEFLT